MIELSTEDGVTTVRLAHGPVNALDLDLVTGISRTFAALDEDPATAAIVFTGTGKAFSAGVDLWRILDDGPEYVEAFLVALGTAFETVFAVGKPVVAGLNGHAIAGGCVFAACCDHRVMADSHGRVGVPEQLVGVPFPVAALEPLRYTIGTQEQRRAVLFGGTYPPAEALARGYVDELVAPDAVVDRATQVARELATSVPPDTYRVSKRQLHAGATERIARYRDVMHPEVLALWLARSTDGWMRDYMNRVTQKR